MDISNTQAVPHTIVSNFKIDFPIKSIEIFGKGNVNDTYLVSTKSSDAKAYILQKLNGNVFPHPEWVLENQLTVCKHLKEKILPGSLHDSSLKVPELVPATSGDFFHRDETGAYWRLTRFIPETQTLDKIEFASDAYETGHALGSFHQLINDIPSSHLKPTIEGFHNTPKYLESYWATSEGISLQALDKESQYCHNFIKKRNTLAPVLETARKNGLLNLNPIHGDPKIDNVLFATDTRKAVGMIDLDTVSPGLLLYDIGDCLRSCCNRLGENWMVPEQIQFDLKLAEALLSGYIQAAESILCSNDIDFIFDAVRLISFELGLRFFTDHLSGDQYFKTHLPFQNLNRARVQFKLTESIEANEPKLRTLVDNLWRNR